jgi:hypothetical protein
MSDWNSGSHATPSRQPKLVTASRSHVGKFGRLFRELPEAIFPDGYLNLLGAEMGRHPPRLGLPENDAGDKPFGTPNPQDNPRIPAGYTYFGQFINHDLTFDPSSLLEQRNDPDSLVDFRTPRFDLDSLYGRGPDEQRYMYQDDGSFILGAYPDLPRTHDRAIITDPRNDENRMVSQLHAAFMLFHNKVIAEVKDFIAAQRLVRWHYQWLILNDYLPLLVPHRALRELLVVDQYVIGRRGDDLVYSQRFRPNLRFFNPREEAFMPVEFSAAAFRFGHSMVRPAYVLNNRGRDSGTKIPLFDPTGKDLRGFRPLPVEQRIEWGYFFPCRPGLPPQLSFRIDEHLAKPLGDLPLFLAPAGPRSLAQRTLKRGLSLGLPSGPDVARFLGIEPLKGADLFEDADLRERFRDSAPLWYYILREAKVYANGEHLGPVGGTIVAETIIGLLWNDAQSYLRVEPQWRPKVVKDVASLLRHVEAPM